MLQVFTYMAAEKQVLLNRIRLYGRLRYFKSFLIKAVLRDVGNNLHKLLESARIQDQGSDARGRMPGCQDFQL